MADKSRIDDLKGLFRDRDIRLHPEEGGPEQGVEQYNKYGIYCDPGGRMEFLCVIMERDDPAANPDGPWTEDDYMPYSVARYDFHSKSWKSEPGNMKLVSSGSFSFLEDENQFFDRLQAYADTLNLSAITATVNADTPDESQP